MDEVSGNLISVTGLDEGLGMFTVKLALGYKRPVFVGGTTGLSGGGNGSIGGGGTGGMDPEELRMGTGAGTVIVATAKLEKIEGRKVFIEAAIRNEEGEVCTTAEVIFVKKRPAAGVL